MTHKTHTIVSKNDAHNFNYKNYKIAFDDICDDNVASYAFGMLHFMKK